MEYLNASFLYILTDGVVGKGNETSDCERIVGGWVSNLGTDSDSTSKLLLLDFETSSNKQTTKIQKEALNRNKKVLIKIHAIAH